jgi:hypothetical protein
VTTRAREREAEQASIAYHAALSQLGVDTVAEAIALWQHVPPTQRAATAERWLNAAVRIILGRRTQSVHLARAYYRLSRALLTGTTVADPFRPDPPNVTLSMLRQQFAELAGPTTAGLENAPQRGAQPREKRSTPARPDDDELIVVEELARLREQELEAERAAEEEIRTVLDALGPKNLEGQVKKIDDSLPANEVDKLRQQAHDKAGARQAAAAARIAMNGARSTSWIMQESDKRAIGWVRISTTGTPCGWCAMLISRGAVYRSARSASVSYDDGDKYHDNCKCIAIPVFDRDWFDKSPLFDLNRKYAELWPQVTRGLGGQSALSAWRRFIRMQQAGAKRAAT